VRRKRPVQIRTPCAAALQIRPYHLHFHYRRLGQWRHWRICRNGFLRWRHGTATGANYITIQGQELRDGRFLTRFDTVQYHNVQNLNSISDTAWNIVRSRYCKRRPLTAIKPSCPTRSETKVTAPIWLPGMGPSRHEN
jgi:hypothetical protein